ncbi:MAG: two pore domain potassium channel family protein [Rhodospirillaceae bacterium]|nr:two pore domain potassium channel family protein [Rhodospirillaceae bacterium]
MAKGANWAGSLLLTGLLVALIAGAVAPGPWFVFLQVCAVVGTAGIIHWLFPGSPFFAVALANFIAIYTCLFVFFWETNFRIIDAWAAFVGYGLPLIGFLAGCSLRRHRIRSIVAGMSVGDGKRLGRVLLWLAPMTVIGGLTFSVPAMHLATVSEDFVFIGMMTVIAAIVLIVSSSVAGFLIEAGLLFEEFFGRMARLLVPAFAFLTFYSLIIVVFAAAYRLVDRIATAPQFIVHGVPQELSFSDALYFSLVTLATVGYGDVTPATNLMRLLSGIEVVCGVLLLLFGFNEIMAHARASRHRDRQE